MEIKNPFANWGDVELWRALHNELPAPDDYRELDYPKALEAAGHKVMQGEVSPSNAATMLFAASDKIRELQARLTVRKYI